MSKLNDILEIEINHSCHDGDTTVLAKLISLLPIQARFNALSDEMQKTIKFDVRDIENDEIQKWSVDAILDEINRDRSDKWTDYNYSDWVEGWFEWSHGEFYELELD